MADYNPKYINKKVYFIVGGKAVVFNNEGKILVMQRSDKSGQGEKWSLPGGAVEDNENPYEGISREIDEEANIKVSDLKAYYVKTSKNEKGDNILIIGYTCKAVFHNVTLNWEHDQYQWLTKEEALKLDLTPDARTFLENI